MFSFFGDIADTVSNVMSRGYESAANTFEESKKSFDEGNYFSSAGFALAGAFGYVTNTLTLGGVHKLSETVYDLFDENENESNKNGPSEDAPDKNEPERKGILHSRNDRINEILDAAQGIGDSAPEFY